MDLADVFNMLHNAVESQNMGKKISQKEMAKNVGVSMRTYQDWKLGNSAPQAARVVMEMLGELDDEDIVVIADDSGISVDVLDGKPGIYSARYAGEDATDKDNLFKLIDDIKEKGFKSSPAHYTAAIAIVTKDKEQTVHGWMYGDVFSYAHGEGGFGYDPMFKPLGYDKTLGELDDAVKSKLSHRFKALELMKTVLETF